MIYSGLIDRTGEIFSLFKHDSTKLPKIFLATHSSVFAILYNSKTTSEEDKQKLLLYYKTAVKRIEMQTKKPFKREAAYRDYPNTKEMIIDFMNKSFNIDGFAYNVSERQMLNFIYKLYDQNFLRFRIGGLYFSPINNPKPELYIRIASTEYNWFDVIWNYVFKNKDQLSSITIVRDDVGLKESGYYYLNNTIKMDMYPIEDFIMLPGNPVLDTNFRLETRQQFQQSIKHLSGLTDEEGIFRCGKFFTK